jgi:hypothetical protein
VIRAYGLPIEGGYIEKRTYWTMTAEIAIFNKSGIALAADSAVTIGKKKVYNSADKLFSLSKYHPVGIMIYDSASFMRIPWEVIIKEYRRSLGRKEAPSRIVWVIKHHAATP